MNLLMKRISSALLALLLVISLLIGAVPAEIFAASLTSNTGTRHDYNATLSSQALTYYTGNYTWEKLSALEGGNENCLDIYNPMFEALHDLMTDTMTNSVSYSSLPDYWEYTDSAAGASGKVIAFYTDSKTSIGSINREHVWPKSHASFKEKNGGCDLHHLRPTFNNVNSSRGNLIMGNVRDTSGYNTYSYDGKKVLYKDSSTCEVNDNIKGDVARILLYVWCRWEEPNLFKNASNPVVGPSDDKNDGGKVIESLDTLLEWCEIDPVDTWEMSRNDRVQDVQGNRNVFIDYPEFAWLIFGRDVPENYDTPSDNGGSASNSCEHQWKNATCTEPKTCSKCGKTQGEANGHSDTDDDNICNICFIAIGCIHQWNTEYDSNSHYQKCTLCSETKNSAVHTLVNNQCACGYVYIPSAGNTFVKVTIAPTDWSGEYLIVCEEKNVAFDGSLTTLDAVRNNISVTIEEDKITLDKDDSDSIFVIASNGSGYSIKSSSGYYVGITGSSNGLKTSTGTAYNHTLSLNSDGSTLIKCGSMILRFNANRDQMRFRYYGSGQQPVTLYKRIEHTHDYTSVVTPPTCTEGGYTTYTCTCGATYTDNEMAVLGHNYTSEETKAATCTEAGELTYTCGNCGDSYTEEIEALGHDYDAVVTDPTCEADGYTTYTCGNCGDSYTDDVVAALPHTNEYTDNGDGTHKYACSVCGAVETASAEHTYDNAQDTDCNDCGAVREVGPIYDASLNFSNLTMNMESSLRLSFQIDPNDIKGVADYYAILYKADGFEEKDVTVRINKDQMVNTYFAEFPLIACDMGEKIEATLYVVDADGTVRYGKTISYSILDYLNMMMGYYENIAKNPSNAGYDAACKWMQLAVETLNYGAAAQTEFGHKTDALVNANLTAEQKAFALAEDPKPEYKCDFGADNRTKEIFYTNLTLNLQERVYGMILIDTANLKSAEKEDLYVEVRDPETGALVQEITFGQMEAGGGSSYWIPISAITPANMTKIYTVQVFAGETALSTLARYSIDSYASLYGSNIPAVTMAALRYGAAAANALAK